MPLDTAGLDTAADAVGTAYDYLALFDSSNVELSGAGYTRIQFTPGASSGGVVNIPAVGPFNVPSGSDVAHFGIFTAVTAGTRGGKEPLDTPTSAYAADGEFNFTGGTISVTST